LANNIIAVWNIKSDFSEAKEISKYWDEKEN